MLSVEGECGDLATLAQGAQCLPPNVQERGGLDKADCLRLWARFFGGHDDPERP